MSLKNYCAKAFILTAYTFFAVKVTASQPPGPPPPSYNVIDRMGVNVAIGSPAVSQTDLSIGGAMGLTHGYTMIGSAFNAWLPSDRGWQDSFYGRTKTITITNSPYSAADDENGLYVSAGSLSAEFSYTESNGTYIFTQTSGGSYSTLKHEVGVGLTWTLANGTRYIFGSSGASLNVYLSEIIYPSGLKVRVHNLPGPKITRVDSSAGYQLKYEYASEGLHRYSPLKITAINNKTCVVSDANPTPACADNDQLWPSSSYAYSGAEIDAFVFSDQQDIDGLIFSATDSLGHTTRYEHESYYANLDWQDGETDPTYVMRLTRIVAPGAVTQYIWDDIENPLIDRLEYDDSRIGYSYLPPAYGPLLRAERYGQTIWYNTNNAVWPYEDRARFTSGGERAISEVETDGGKISFVDGWRSEHTINDDGLVTLINPDVGPDVSYVYDDRGNVEQKVVGQGDGAEAFSWGYPPSCTSANYKYCNKPIWQEPPSGSNYRTDYTYHAQSGKVAAVTKPADEHGRRPQTRYYYSQHTPSHNGPLTSQIWMLAYEEHCRNSASVTVANGGPHPDDTTSCAAGAGDEVRIEYEYEPKNLQLKGRVVIADGQSRRTCYSYDLLGNRTGETQPKGTGATCPN